MTVSREQLLARLADGEWHSGAGLAAGFGVSRAAVGQHVERLRSSGWSIDGRRGLGYRLTAQCQPLTRTALETGLRGWAERVAALELLIETDSTSRRIERSPVPADGPANICIAETQSRGRGRHGRTWHSVPGASITFSVARAFHRGPAELGALALAVGVAEAECLQSAGIDGIGLKWPNDLVHAGGKLGGILIDLRGESGGSARATVGVGVNFAAASACAASDAVSICDLIAPPAPDRGVLAGALMAATLEALEQYERDGFDTFLGRWRQLDRLADCWIRAHTPAGALDGIARGIDGRGALVLEEASGRRHSLHSGDVTLAHPP